MQYINLYLLDTLKATLKNQLSKHDNYNTTSHNGCTKTIVPVRQSHMKFNTREFLK